MSNYIKKIAKDIVRVSEGNGWISKESWWWNEEVQKMIKIKREAYKE